MNEFDFISGLFILFIIILAYMISTIDNQTINIDGKNYTCIR